MFRMISIFAIGLGLGGGLGAFIVASKGVTLDGHDHGAHGHEAAAKSVPEQPHKAPIDVSAANAP